ncbi:heme peroxidase [Serinicoccus chungangensis]|uniref:heme peroxidase n=1 Tax=Serinicoccus chungangensis TaxID=767452 RepID=UPI00111AAB74|nr:heme peroxidase [Serinicoccus chungangensis]
MSEAMLEQLSRAVKRDLGTDADRWFRPAGYESAALAVIDSIYSTGNHYTGVINAVNRYRRARIDEGANPDRDGARELVSAVDRWGGVDGLIERTNKWKTSTRAGAPTKAEAAYGAAEALVEQGMDSVIDVRGALAGREKQESSPLKRRWLNLPGQRSGLTWTYFLMLCGVPGVKADRMVVGYVSRVFGQEVSGERARELVGGVARQLETNELHLDHAIWRHESGRAVFLGEGSDG